MFISWILLLFHSVLFADQPEFKGGQNRLASFISNNLIYPEYARQNCLQGTIYISFKLNHQGRVFDSQVHKGYGIDLDNEALRIVRLTTGRWIVPPSHDTTAALILPINFSLQDFKCEQRSRDEIKAAISAYKARMDLTRAILNYYQKKHAGQANAADEKHILNLKNQLGYDDKFIDRLIRQAKSKLKQADKESACEDLSFVRNLGSDKADALIAQYCR